VERPGGDRFAELGATAARGDPPRGLVHSTGASAANVAGAATGLGSAAEILPPGPPTLADQAKLDRDFCANLAANGASVEFRPRWCRAFVPALVAALATSLLLLPATAKADGLTWLQKHDCLAALAVAVENYSEGARSFFPRLGPKSPPSKTATPTKPHWGRLLPQWHALAPGRTRSRW
jgi:hypothetical protein